MCFLHVVDGTPSPIYSGKVKVWSGSRLFFKPLLCYLSGLRVIQRAFARRPPGFRQQLLFADGNPDFTIPLHLTVFMDPYQQISHRRAGNAVAFFLDGFDHLFPDA